MKALSSDARGRLRLVNPTSTMVRAVRIKAQCKSWNSDTMVRRVFRVGLALAALGLVAACSQQTPAHLRPLSKNAMHLLGERGMSPRDPIFIRIYKAESELEVWKQRADGRFHHFKTYPICNWSGKLGPKLQQGDKQSPEGFYKVSRHQMNPNSKFHLSFNLGYPNTYDKANGRTGNFLMVHGDCRSAGCYAMTDALVEEIYALAREAFEGGQKEFHVHAYPFRMTQENMARHRKHKWYTFWHHLKEGHDAFEATRIPPKIHVCARRYLVNAEFVNYAGRVDPSHACPVYVKRKVEPFVPSTQQAFKRIVVPGRKVRRYAFEPSEGSRPAGAYGLTKSPDEPQRSLWTSLLKSSGKPTAATRALKTN